jgi:hypothetical protein
VSSVVGRETELRTAEAFVAAGDGLVFAILGEPGIGKTTVWQEAVVRAGAHGATVMVARPSESEAKLSFAGLADLLARVPDQLFARLPAPQRAGLDAALLRAASTRSAERRVVGAALLSLLRLMAADAPVVLAVDDLHWLDAPSAAALEFALRRLTDDRVGAIVSLRSQEAEHSSLLRLERVELLELGPLSVAALHRILADMLGRSFPPPTLVRIAQASAGNPLHALEIARLLDRGAEAADATLLPVPRSLAAVRCSSPRPASSRLPPSRSNARSTTTGAARCRSSAPARCSSRGRCFAA